MGGALAGLLVYEFSPTNNEFAGTDGELAARDPAAPSHSDTGHISHVRRRSTRSQSAWPTARARAALGDMRSFWAIRPKR